MLPSLVFFNLFANATFSLWIGMLIVAIFISLFRVRDGVWKLFLLMSPFLKVLADFFKGIPETSILLKNIDPYAIAPGLRYFTIGLGWGSFGPMLQLVFSVKSPTQEILSASSGDFIYFFLYEKIGVEGLQLILYGSIAISFFFLIRRLVFAFQFERIRRFEQNGSQIISRLSVGKRKVEIYISKLFSGTPFTGGLFKPYICFPEQTYKLMSENEINAVITHELGHIQQFDIIFSVFIQILGDVFWFIPGYRWLSRRIDCLREIVADQFVLKKGIEGGFLASALLKLNEIPDSKNRFILYSALTREKSLLQVRIERLLGKSTEKDERWIWKFLPLRLALTALVTGAVLNSTLGGNYSHRLEIPESLVNFISKVSKWGQ